MYSTWRPVLISGNVIFQRENARKVQEFQTILYQEILVSIQCVVGDSLRFILVMIKVGPGLTGLCNSRL